MHRILGEWTGDREPMMQPSFHPEYVSGHSAFTRSGGCGLAALSWQNGILHNCP